MVLAVSVFLQIGLRSPRVLALSQRSPVGCFTPGGRAALHQAPASQASRIDRMGRDRAHVHGLWFTSGRGHPFAPRLMAVLPYLVHTFDVSDKAVSTHGRRTTIGSFSVARPILWLSLPFPRLARHAWRCTARCDMRSQAQPSPHPGRATALMRSIRTGDVGGHRGIARRPPPPATADLSAAKTRIVRDELSTPGISGTFFSSRELNYCRQARFKIFYLPLQLLILGE